MTLKSLNFSLLVVTVESEELSQLADELNKKRIMAPDFFQYAPIVVHIENSILNLDLAKVKEIVIEYGFILAGVSGELSDLQKESLHADNIAILRRSKRLLKKGASEDKSTNDKPVERRVERRIKDTAVFVANEVKTKVITGRVRSGQQIYAKECDLVINGDVSAGAEIIADGNIHIYGTLRGRAIAGAMGDQTASVFCRVLAPELVSIAGVFKLNEGLPGEYLGKSCIISLRDGQPVLENLN